MKALKDISLNIMVFNWTTYCPRPGIGPFITVVLVLMNMIHWFDLHLLYTCMWWINLVITVSRSCLIFCNYSCCTYGARSWDHQTWDSQTRDSQTWDSETQDSKTRDRELKKWLIAELTHLNLTKPNLWTLVGCQLPIECPSMKFKGLI